MEECKQHCRASTSSLRLTCKSVFVSPEITTLLLLGFGYNNKRTMYFLNTKRDGFLCAPPKETESIGSSQVFTGRKDIRPPWRMWQQR